MIDATFAAGDAEALLLGEDNGFLYSYIHTRGIRMTILHTLGRGGSRCLLPSVNAFHRCHVHELRG